MLKNLECDVSLNVFAKKINFELT